VSIAELIRQRYDEGKPDRANSIKRVADLLGVSTRQVWRYVADGRLKAERYSERVIRIRDSEIERFRNACAYGGETV
jgi:excisionase family DNA binding protein